MARHQHQIGSSIVTDAGLLPAVIESFTKDFPRVALHVLHEDIAVQQYENLRGRRAELVLGRLNAKSEPDLIAEPLFNEPLIPMGAAFDSFWDSQIRETLTRCLFLKGSSIDGWSSSDQAG